MKHPSTNLQAPEKFQISIGKDNERLDWNLVVGVSLELGAWNLVLPFAVFASLARPFFSNSKLKIQN